MNNINFERIQLARFLGSSSAKVILSHLIQQPFMYSWFTHGHAVISLECRPYALHTGRALSHP